MTSRFRPSGLLRAAALGALGAATLALATAPAAGQSIGELQGKIDAAEADAQSLAAEIDAQGAELVAIRGQAASAAAREAELTAVLAEGEEREANLEADVAAAQERLAAARERLRRAIDVLSDRLVSIFKGDTPDETLVLLNAEGFDDLTTRAELLRRIQDADSQLAARVRSLRDSVEKHLATVEEARDQQAAHNDEVESARDQIAAARARAEAQAAALAAARAAQAASLESLRSQVSGWTSQVQEAQAISAAQAQEAVAGWVGDWAIPAGIVMCESGGNYGALNPSSGAGGAYQIIPSTWQLYGGSGAPQNASQAEQDRIAAQIWADSGASAWECAG
jgi:peptidoglycan hydrolase CwlO-like protein